MRIAACALIASMCGSASAVAEPIVNYTFVGEVTAVLSDAPPRLPVGTQMVFVVPFDYGAHDFCPSPQSGGYMFPGSTVSYNGFSQTSFTTGLEVNNVAGSCSFPAQALVIRIVGSFPNVALILPPTPGDAIPVLMPGIPISFSLLASADQGVLALGSGHLAAVPEPPLAALLLVAVSGLAARLRSKGRDRLQ